MATDRIGSTDHVNDPIYGTPWAHVWRVTVLSDVNYDVLVTLFNLYKPAQTTVLFTVVVTGESFELREDGSLELREDGSYELRE